MTAFARCDRETDLGVLTWEVRTVNHRYLDISPRLPDAFRAMEPELRERVGKRLNRGRVDLTLRYQTKPATPETDLLDEDLVHRLTELAHRIEVIAHNVSGLRTVDLLRWPGVIKAPEPDTEALCATALALLDETLGQVAEARAREGAVLRELLVQRLDAMGGLVAELRKVLPEITEHYRERLLERLGELREQLDAGRLEQEIALFAQKTDVHEELDRLDSHVKEVRRVLGQSQPIGRRLDFLMQELNREANTLGSKAADIRVTNTSVELKVLIEQMREQVQNLE